MADPIEIFLSRLQHPLIAGIELKLERMQRLLSMCGNPQKRLPPVIHVAGTNGKGSLIAYLQAIFEVAGYRVHRYTSPHLVQFRERIVLQGKEIENAYLESILKYVAHILTTQPATFFEATTVLAFLAFAEKPADVLLLETGMGGRLDATNVVEKPILTAITPVAFDHCDYLGDSLAKIAAEKAGILKAGTLCVVGKQQEPAQQAIEEKAATLAVPLARYGLEWKVEWEDGQIFYRSPTRHVLIKPSLAGNHQFDNAGTAVACIDNLPQFTISDAHITTGLANAIWPARLQKLDSHSYRRFLSDGMELWLDGGHNPQGGEILANWLQERNCAEAYLICGMVKDKDTQAFLAPLQPCAKKLMAITIPDESTSQPAAKIAAAAKGLGMDVEIAASIENALQTIAAHAKTPAIICICGSLYLAGKVLAADTAK